MVSKGGNMVPGRRGTDTVAESSYNPHSEGREKGERRREERDREID